MNSTVTTLMMVALGLIVLLVGYAYFTEPQPIADRMENAANQLGAGRVGEAVDELNNVTPADQVRDDVNDMLAPAPATSASPSL